MQFLLNYLLLQGNKHDKVSFSKDWFPLLLIITQLSEIIPSLGKVLYPGLVGFLSPIISRNVITLKGKMMAIKTNTLHYVYVYGILLWMVHTMK